MIGTWSCAWRPLLGRLARGALAGLVLCAAATVRAEDGDDIVTVKFANTADCATIHNIVITHIFKPGDRYVKPGDCVRFTNEHMIEHSAVGMDREFNSGVPVPGGTALFRFDEEGTVPYNRGVHPPMVGVLVIEAEG